MGIRKNQVNRKKPGNGRRTIFLLLLVILAICGILFVLERLKVSTEVVVKPAVEERHTVPPRQPYAHIEMQTYTSAATERRPLRRKKQVSPGTVAIIVDDMGTSLHEVKSLMDINVPLTLSIIPGLAKDREVAKAAHDRGYQVMLHIPMEPKGYPKQRLEENGLLLAQSDDEVAERVNAYFRQVPYAVGANNHMGSRFSEDGHKMKIVLNQLKAHGLFYVDSRTTPNSEALSLARSLEVYAAGRNVFLDNDQDIASITSQIDQLAALARKKGSAIGICHPHKITIQALAANLPRLKAEGITFVPAGDLVR